MKSDQLHVDRKAGKDPVHLLPPRGIAAAARVMHWANENKGYKPGDWRECPPEKAIEVYGGAAMRHILELFKGNLIDPDSGESHAACLAANGNILAELVVLGQEAERAQALRRERAQATSPNQAPAPPSSSASRQSFTHLVDDAIGPWIAAFGKLAWYFGTSPSTGEISVVGKERVGECRNVVTVVRSTWTGVVYVKRDNYHARVIDTLHSSDANQDVLEIVLAWVRADVDGFGMLKQYLTEA